MSKKSIATRRTRLRSSILQHEIPHSVKTGNQDILTLDGHLEDSMLDSYMLFALQWWFMSMLPTATNNLPLPLPLLLHKDTLFIF